MASRFFVVPLVAASLAFASFASAAPSAADKETARGLMAQGRAAREKGDLQAALKAFEAADAIMHVPTTGLELARSQEAAGLLVEARDTALRVMRSPEEPGEPAPFKRARQEAAALSSELEARIPSLTIEVKNVPDGQTATVTLDGNELSSVLIGQPRKLDPGHHVVVAKAGTAEGREEVDVAEKESKTVTVALPAQEAAAPAPPAPEQETTEKPPPATEQPAAGRSGASKALMFGGFGLAGAGLIAGTVTGILSMSQTSSIKSSPACSGNLCNPSEDADIRSARAMATVSTVSFIVAGAGAAVGVVGLLTGKSSPSSSEPSEPASDRDQSARVEPWVGLGAVGVRGRF
jgi:hypothetical protein